jgi:hypothetical protein
MSDSHVSLALAMAENQCITRYDEARKSTILCGQKTSIGWEWMKK